MLQCLMLLIFSSSAHCYGQEFQLDGEIVYSTGSADGGYTYEETKYFTLSRNDLCWKIRTVDIGRGKQVASKVQFDEATCDGSNIFYLRQFNTNKLDLPNSTPSRDVCLAEGRVQSSSVPTCMHLNLIYPLWLAYCASEFLPNVIDGRLVSPLFASRDFFTEAVPQPFVLPAELTLDRAGFANEVRWFSEGNWAEHRSDGSFSLNAYSPPYEGGFLHATYETTSWTNYHELALPLTFALKVFAPVYYEGNTANTNLSLAFIISGVVKSVRSGSNYCSLPRLTTKTLITDSRVDFNDSPISYVGQTNWLTVAEIHAQLERAQLGSEGGQPKASSLRVLIVCTILAISIMFAIAGYRISRGNLKLNQMDV